jgi:hypothetical protein
MVVLSFFDYPVVVALLDEDLDKSDCSLQFLKLLLVCDHFLRLEIAAVGVRIQTSPVLISCFALLRTPF